MCRYRHHGSVCELTPFYEVNMRLTALTSLKVGETLRLKFTIVTLCFAGWVNVNGLCVAVIFLEFTL